MAPLGVVVTWLVQDTQERLIYRAQYLIRVRHFPLFAFWNTHQIDVSRGSCLGGLRSMWILLLLLMNTSVDVHIGIDVDVDVGVRHRVAVFSAGEHPRLQAQSSGPGLTRRIGAALQQGAGQAEGRRCRGGLGGGVHVRHVVPDAAANPAVPVQDLPLCRGMAVPVDGVAALQAFVYKSHVADPAARDAG